MELSCRDLLSLLPCKCATYINTNGAPGYHLAKRFYHLPSVFLHGIQSHKHLIDPTAAHHVFLESSSP